MMANEKRLIDANALMKAIKSFRWISVPGTLKLLFDYLQVIIKNQPTVDAVEVVHGRWEDGICTMCGYPIPTDSKCDFIDEDDCLFCYHCGAKMDGGNEDG